MPKFNQVLRTTVRIENLLREVVSCMRIVDSKHPDNPAWEWREISVSEAYEFQRTEATTVLHKHVRFRGKFHRICHIDVECHFLLTSTQHEVDSGLGETTTQAHPLKVQRARIFIEHLNRSPHLGFDAKFRNRNGNGLMMDSVKDWKRKE